MILLDLDDFTAHAVGDFTQLPLLVGCCLVEGGNAQIDIVDGFWQRDF